MTATPPVPPGDEPAPEDVRGRDVSKTVIGLAGLAFFGFFVYVATGFFGGLPSYSCQVTPGCNHAMNAIALFLIQPGLLVIWGASLLVSVGLLLGGRRASFVSFIGGAVMLGCAVISMILILSAPEFG